VLGSELIARHWLAKISRCSGTSCFVSAMIVLLAGKSARSSWLRQQEVCGMKSLELSLNSENQCWSVLGGVDLMVRYRIPQQHCSINLGCKAPQPSPTQGPTPHRSTGTLRGFRSRQCRQHWQHDYPLTIYPTHIYIIQTWRVARAVSSRLP
jgi:hypothetical protein